MVEASFRLALAVSSHHSEASPASLPQTMGSREEAIQRLFDSVAQEPGNARSRINLAQALEGLALNRAGEKERGVLLSLCLDDDALAFVIPSIVTLMKNDEGFLALQKGARRGEDPFVAVTPPVAKFFRDPLMLAALPRMTIADGEVEEVLTHVRQCILSRFDFASGLDAVDPQVPKEFICSLARQCSVSKYVFFAAENELQRAASLREAIQDALRQEKASSRPLESALATAALYDSLHSLEGSERLLQQPMGEWSEAFRLLVQEQIVDREREREIARNLIPITAIDDAMSVAVRSQYEENPYPRWVTVQRPRPESIDSLLNRLLPRRPLRACPRPVQVLIAGCGTGMIPIHCARAYPDTEILAVDLSLASLAYAARMSEQLGISRITYRQADILEMGGLAKRFTVIDCCGVLHHLADPMAGWRVLVSLLESDGLMKLALYSEKARHAIRTAREYARPSNLARSAEEIRRCRRLIMDAPAGHPVREILTYGDFYTLDGCRDMLMPVHECQFTLPRIQECLDQLGLRFLGFESSEATQDRFRQIFPGDDAGENLTAWHQFEEIHPDTFIGMYVFWCCKK
jgi:2-polyprenyl-3-methyl-5-hydroxy-6-metoxy-1,4-benzoquinol methylase